jgi:hypothetical protein
MISQEGDAMSSLVQDRGTVQDMGGLASLPGLDTVRDQLAAVIAVIKAERARRDAGMPVTRPRWKNLVFTGSPGTGKSRTAVAVARIYHDLGVLPTAHITELTSADLTDPTFQTTACLLRDATFRARGGLLLITDAHTYADQQFRDHQVLRCLLDPLTQFRDDLVVILAGQLAQLHALLRASPALAARFPAIIDFPGYTPRHLAAIFATLAAEAGFTLSAPTAEKATAVLEAAHRGSATGSARLAIKLLDQSVVRQALRIDTSRQTRESPELGAICAADIPDHLHPTLIESAPADGWPGQYL